MTVSRSTLNWLHGAAAVAHFAQAAAMTGFIAKDYDEAYKWPLTQLGWQKVLTDKTQRYNLGLLVPAFPLLSSVNHLVSVASPAYYDMVLREKVNVLRWCEFSLSAGICTWIIAVLSGVTELRTLVSLMILNVGLQMMGLLIEKRKAENATRGELFLLMMIAWAIFAAIWVQIVMSFAAIVEWDSAAKPPRIVYAIISSMIALFCSFGILQLLYVMDMVSFETYEVGFIGLSLSAKSLLGWMVTFGVLSAKKRFD